MLKFTASLAINNHAKSIKESVQESENTEQKPLASFESSCLNKRGVDEISSLSDPENPQKSFGSFSNPLQFYGFCTQ